MFHPDDPDYQDHKTFFKTRFARYKKVKLVKCPISRHILAKKRKIHLKNDFSQF